MFGAECYTSPEQLICSVNGQVFPELEAKLETRFYQARGLNIERIALDLERIFLTQSYQVQHFGNQNQMTIQFKKGGDFAAILGMQAALTLTLQSFPEGITAVIGQQKWADKAAAGAVGMLVLWPLAFTAGAGAIRQSNLSEQVLNTLDTMVRQQSAQVQIGPAPLQMLPSASTTAAPVVLRAARVSAPLSLIFLFPISAE